MIRLLGGDAVQVSDSFRQRFEPFVPELLERATVLVAESPEPRPQPEDLVEQVAQLICGRTSVADLRREALRQLESVADNLIIHLLLKRGDFDAAFARLAPHLRRWAAVLSRGLPPPRPAPDELVHDVFIKLRRAPMFCEVAKPLGYACQVMKNHVVDLVRKRSRELVAFDELRVPGVSFEHSFDQVEAIARRAALTREELCMLLRVVFERLAVPKAQRECGGPSGEPYYALDKILTKVATSLGLERDEPRGDE